MAMENRVGEKGNKVIDFKDSLSSISLLKVTQVFGKMKPSEILEIRGVEAETRQDLFQLLPRLSYEIAGEDEDTAKGPACIRIRKR